MVGARRFFLAGVLSLTLGGSVLAQAPAATIGLRVNIPPVCIASSLDYGVLDFGSHGSLSNAVQASSSLGAGTIQITCASGLSYSVSLDAGLHGNAGQRYMQGSGGDVIAYQLFSDAQLNVLWDSNVPLNRTGTGIPQQIPLYGRVPAQTTPAAGAYRDTVGVTVAW